MSSDILENLRLELRRGCLVLAVLAKLRSEYHGYALAKTLAESGLEIDENTLYPLLRRLESQKLLASQWRVEDKRNKRFYRLSEEGQSVLEWLLVEWRNINGAIEKLLDAPLSDREERSMKRELTNQELLDRYVHSVKMLLPPDKVDDIAAEIRSNLESLVEDRAAELGRELRPEEMSAILKHHGHPMVVASRYRDPSRAGPDQSGVVSALLVHAARHFRRVGDDPGDHGGVRFAGNCDRWLGAAAAWARYFAGGILHSCGRHSVIRRLGIPGVQVPIFGSMEAGVSPRRAIDGRTARSLRLKGIAPGMGR